MFRNGCESTRRDHKIFIIIFITKFLAWKLAFGWFQPFTTFLGHENLELHVYGRWKAQQFSHSVQFWVFCFFWLCHVTSTCKSGDLPRVWHKRGQTSVRPLGCHVPDHGKHKWSCRWNRKVRLSPFTSLPLCSWPCQLLLPSSVDTCVTSTLDGPSSRPLWMTGQQRREGWRSAHFSVSYVPHSLPSCRFHE